MPTISTADFKNGLGLRIKDKVYTIVEFQHVKPGKGGAFVRYKTRDIKSGRVVENTCNAGTKFESVMLTTREFQYLYNDGTDYIFMDNESYEQVPVPEDMVGENSKWLRENDICQLLFADDELMGVTPPMFIETTIVQTDPGFKGDTVQGSTKPATIDTGAVIQVPMYLNEGEVIKVDTRDGKFVSRLATNSSRRTHAPEIKIDGIGISPDVLTAIVSRAVSDVEGIASVGVKDLATNLVSMMLSSKAPASEPAVEAEVVGDKLALTVRVVVFFGYPFKKLAEAVRAAVVAAIDAQVGVEVERVDVCIDGLVFPKE